MKLKAYAKINLTLDVTGKREDGYHTLDTVMHTISLYDDVVIERTNTPGIRLKSDKSYLPADGRNTAWAAAQLFLERCGLEKEGLEITLWKCIPSRAGLGGGSADAAAVLRGLNELFGAGLPVSELMALGEKVGADVPFCVHGGCCRCRGVGEQVEPAAPLPDCRIVLCRPPVGMSTPKAYALLDGYPDTPERATPAMLEALEAGDLHRIGGCLSNRFDRAMRLGPVREIRRILLDAGALGAMMSGSGSAVYGLFESVSAAEAAMKRLAGKGELFLSRPMGR